MKLRVSGAQISVTPDIGANAATIARAVEFAASEGADILLTPEGSLSGYTHQFDSDAAGKALEEITALARERGIALALGTCFVEPDDGKCYNQIRFYDGGGDYQGFHSKTLRCGSMTQPSKGEIEHYAVSELRTFSVNGAIIGGLICNDMWANPACTPLPDSHLSQQLSDMGAQVIFHAVNGGRDGGEWSRGTVWDFHESNLRMRARAGRVWVVIVDNCEPTHIPCSAPSGVIDTEGNWACRVEEQGERFFAYTVDL
jgi:predicted amidohydrolase